MPYLDLSRLFVLLLLNKKMSHGDESKAYYSDEITMKLVHNMVTKP